MHCWQHIHRPALGPCGGSHGRYQQGGSFTAPTQGFVHCSGTPQSQKEKRNGEEDLWWYFFDKHDIFWVPYQPCVRPILAWHISHTLSSWCHTALGIRSSSEPVLQSPATIKTDTNWWSKILQTSEYILWSKRSREPRTERKLTLALVVDPKQPGSSNFPAGLAPQNLTPTTLPSLTFFLQVCYMFSWLWGSDFGVPN